MQTRVLLCGGPLRLRAELFAVLCPIAHNLLQEHLPVTLLGCQTKLHSHTKNTHGENAVPCCIDSACSSVLCLTMDCSSDKVVASYYTTKVGSNDVLLGRGDHSVKNEGNIRFRLLVKAQKARYKNVADVSEKHDIACEIIRAVRDRGGQFLRRVEPLGEAQELGVPSEEEAWVPAEESIVIKKCKQAFRDKPPKRENFDVAGLTTHNEGSPQQDPFSELHSPFDQLQRQQSQQPNQLGLQIDDALARRLLTQFPRQTQQMDLNAQLAQLLESSSTSSVQQQQQQQLSSILNAEAAMAAELQRRQGVEQTLALLTRQSQQGNQQHLGQNLIQQLAQAQLQGRQTAALLSNPSANTQMSITQLLRQQQNPPRDEWLDRALSSYQGGRSAAASGSLFSRNAFASPPQDDRLNRLQEALAQRDNTVALQEAQRQRGQVGLQALQQLRLLQLQLQQAQQHPPPATSAARSNTVSELEMLRTLLAHQQQQQQQQMRMAQLMIRPDAEGAVALGSSSPPVPFSPFARKRSCSSPDNKQSQQESPLSDKEFASTDESSLQKRFKTEHKSDSSSMSHDSSGHSAAKC